MWRMKKSDSKLLKCLGWVGHKDGGKKVVFLVVHSWKEHYKTKAKIHAKKVENIGKSCTFFFICTAPFRHSNWSPSDVQSANSSAPTIAPLDWVAASTELLSNPSSRLRLPTVWILTSRNLTRHFALDPTGHLRCECKSIVPKPYASSTRVSCVRKKETAILKKNSKWKKRATGGKAREENWYCESYSKLFEWLRELALLIRLLKSFSKWYEKGVLY